MNAESGSTPDAPGERRHRSERFLETVAPYDRILLVSHVNPDPDALASMLGLNALISQRQPGKEIVMTVDGMVARAENQAMVDLIPIPLVPVGSTGMTPATAMIMVDTQPRTGRRESEATTPVVVLDHHETGGVLDGVKFLDLRPTLGATSTIVTGYLLEQGITVSPKLATALLYGIESEIDGYPREAGPLDDGALVWLFPRADKDLLAQIRNPKLPQSHFATFQHGLVNAFLYRDVIVSWLGPVTQPDIVSELADFFIRFNQVNWALTIGHFGNLLKLSLRVAYLDAHSGDVLREVVQGIGSAGGHDKRAGGAVPLPKVDSATVDVYLTLIRRRLLERLNVDEKHGRRLVEWCPTIPAP